MLPYILSMDAHGSDFNPDTCRAARALLQLSQQDLADRARVARLTVADFERGARKPMPTTLATIRAALEAAGVRFIPGGAALRSKSGAGSGGDARLSTILRALQADAARLRRLGVRGMSVFGSTARGEAGPDSDIDLLVELDTRRGIDLLDYAGIVAEIQKVVPQRVDVALKSRLKPHVAPEALRDEIRVF